MTVRIGVEYIKQIFKETYFIGEYFGDYNLFVILTNGMKMSQMRNY